jgi:hypothetical protein
LKVPFAAKGAFENAMNKKFISRAVSGGMLAILAFFAATHSASAATLAVSPTGSTVTVGGTSTVNIMLDTAGQAVYGVDVYSLHFNPAILQVVDVDSGTAGVQIAPGALMASTQYNLVNNSTGIIQFSQTPSTGSANYTGSGVLATITFQAIAVGTSNLTFDFTSGSTTDCNVAGLYSDLLTGVTNGSYTANAAADTTAPSVPTGLTANAASSTIINLSWTASTDNVAVAGYQVFRCQGASCTPSVQVATSTSASFVSSGLLASTVYGYRIKAYDAAMNISGFSTAAYATTLAAPDVTPPTLSSIAAGSIVQTGVTITWVTNENSDSQVDYGTTVAYGASSVLNAALVTSHSVVLSGLTANTTYHYRVKSRDAAGNLALSADQTFTTAASLPVISSVLSSGISQSNATISWVTNVPTNGQVKYGLTSVYGSTSALVDNTTKTTSHSVPLSGLAAGTTYHYQAISLDASGNTATSSDNTFTTQSAPDTTVPTVSITSPSTSGQTFSGTMTVSSVASDPTVAGQVTSGLFSQSLLIDGTVFASSSIGNLSASLDTTTLTNNTHALTATARDNAGNNANSSAVSIIVYNLSNATRYPRNIALSSLEGITTVPPSTAVTASVISPSTQAVLSTQALTASATGTVTVTFQATFPQTVSIRVAVAGYLSQLLTNIDTTVNSLTPISTPQLLAGDLNSDNSINSLDYSIMNSHWLQNYSQADINKDGLVNSLDFAILKNNWGKAGQ